MQNYIEQIKIKYNYDDKIINALTKVIPALIEYYGIEYEDTILNAINDTEIICCNSYQTISKIKEEKKLTPKIGNTQLKDIESEGAYLSNIQIIYNEIQNKYEIIKQNRKIVISHTYNLDSPKGLEVLILNICRTIKAENEEYTVEGNTLIQKEGLSERTYQISIDEENINLGLSHEINIGIHIGSLLYDTEQIESIILKDKYNTHKYDYLRLIIRYIKEVFELKEILNEEELLKNNSFKNIYQNKEQFEELSKRIDECLNIEHEMVIYTMNREEKDRLEQILKETFEEKMIKELVILKKESDKIKRVKTPEY